MTGIDPTKAAPPVTEALPPDPGTFAGFYRRIRTKLAGDGVDSHVARGALTSLLIQVVGAALSFGGQVVLARALGQHGFGAYLYALAAMNLVQVLGKLELDGAATKFIGSYVATQQWSLARGYVGWSRRVVFGASVLVAALGALAIALRFNDLASDHPGLPYALFVACAFLPVNGQLLLNSAFLQGLKRFGESQATGAVIRPMLLILGIVVLRWGVGRTLSPAAAVAVNLAATTLALAVAVSFLRSRWPRPLHGVLPTFRRRAWMSAASGLFVVGLSQLVVSQTLDVVVVGTILSSAEAGVYGAASQLTALVSFGQASVTFVAAPLIADLYARQRRDELQGLIRLVLKVSAVVTLPVLVGLIVFGKYILGLYGAGFSDGYSVLVVLAIAASTVSLLGSLAGFLLTMTDYQHQAAVIVGVSAGLNLVLTLIMTPMYGLIGTAVATLIATVARSAALAVFIRRRMGLSLVPF